ncbi:MAG TPA: V-type ATPase subunit [Synergistaceae bacterium]|nr:V-type ATPase subunit [Synergistaceae bacterium]
MSLLAFGERLCAGAKARTLRGRLLEDAVYWQLLHCEDVGEIVDRLGTTPEYREVLEKVPREIHRSELEELLDLMLLRESGAFLGYLSGPRKAFLRAWVGLSEADGIKRALRRLAAGRGERDALRHRLEALPYCSFSVEGLLAADRPEAVREVLRPTPYFHALREPLRRFTEEGGGSLYGVEMALDGVALKRLYKSAQELPPGEREGVLSLAGSLVDLTNVFWLYRGRFYFAQPPEEMLNRLLPVRHRVRIDLLRRLAGAGSGKDFWGELSDSPYRPAMDQALSEELFVDRGMEAFLFRQATRLFAGGSPGFPMVVAYLFLRHYEVADLKTLVEDVRYGYTDRDAAVFLVRPILPGRGSVWR